jgi:hypothetical protein
MIGHQAPAVETTKADISAETFKTYLISIISSFAQRPLDYECCAIPATSYFPKGVAESQLAGLEIAAENIGRRLIGRKGAVDLPSLHAAVDGYYQEVLTPVCPPVLAALAAAMAAQKAA